MATTENNFTGNGTRTEHPFSFPYLNITDVKIGLTLGTGAEQVLATTKYTFPNATTLRLSPIDSATTWQEDSGAPKTDIKVRVYRQTADAVTASTFYPGSAIRSSDLNDNFLQNLYVTQEARNITGDSTTVANEAKTLAETADTNATAAVATANTASSTATTANNTATTANTTANTASTNATNAVNTANAASAAVGDKIAKDGSTTITANIPFNSKKITGLADPTSAQDGATKAYVDAHIIDDDNFSSDSATKPPSQQSVKAYIGTTNYTKTEADARYFTQDTETIDSTETWSAGNTVIATTQAIDNRIIALTTEVGGFVPLANETSFPDSNPDINDGTGTLISIKALASDLTSNGSGVATITNGAGSGKDVTITGLANSTTYSAGVGLILETTDDSGDGSASPPRKYTFHRQVPNATDTAAVAAKATEIGRLGTAAAVADMALLGTADCVADMAILGTSDVVADLNTLATADIVADLDALGPKATDIGTCATKITDISSCAGNLSYTEDLGSIADALTTGSTSAISTVAANITEVQSFDDTYKVASSAPSSGVTEGDLWYDSTNNVLKYYNGSSWASISAGISNLIEDQTPELYAALDCNNKNLTEVATVSGDNLQIDFGAIA